MNIDLVRLDLGFRWTLLALAALLGGLDFWAQGENPLFKSLFVIAVAGLVGYFTNYLAIKMLFQPKRGRVLGWRGLVPKNQAQIARSLGESVQEQLLSPDVILAYIRERELIERATQSLEQWLDQRLQSPEARHAITARLIEWLGARGGGLMAGGLDLSAEALRRLARNPELIAQYWNQLRVMLVDFLQSAENREMAAQRLQFLFQQQMPQLAEWLDRALEDYLRQKSTIGSVGLGLKSLVALDRDAIAHLLQRFADDPQVAEQLMQGLDAVIDGLGQELASDATQARVQAHLVDWVEKLAELSRRYLLPASIEQLGIYLNDADNWGAIEETLMSVLGWAKTRSLTYLSGAEGQAALRLLIERLVQKSNVTELVEEQVMKLDTDELEAMVLDNTGGNLTVIQVLGGGLGIIAGTVQVHLAFAVPILLLVALVYAAYQLNEWQQDRLSKP